MARERELVALILVALCTLGSAAGVREASFEQNLDLKSHLAVLTETVSFKGAATAVTLCYPSKYIENAAYIRFCREGEKKSSLPHAIAETGQPSNYTCLEVQLGEAGTSGKLESTLVMPNLLAPTPAVVAQDDPQVVTFLGDLHPVSPYRVASHRLSVSLPSSGALEYSRAHPVAASGGRIAFGPYADRAPFAPSEPLVLRFKTPALFLHVERLERDIVVSHWGRVNVEERYRVHHAGARLAPAFSRLSYMTADLQRDRAVIWQLSFALPGPAQYLYFKDTIGNISSSSIHKVVVKGKPERTMLYARPRYPLMGGWRTEFRIGYSLPLESVAKRRRDGRYSFSFGFTSPLDQVYNADEIVTDVILPEGSTGLKVDSGALAFDGEDHVKTFTYLDTFGRPTLRLTKRNAVREHAQTVHVTYDFHDAYLMQEPLLLSGVVMALFLVMMVVSRLDLTIAKGAEWRAQQERAMQSDALSGLSSVVAAFNRAAHAMAAAADAAASASVAEASAKVRAARATAEQALQDMMSLHDNVAAVSSAAAADAQEVHAAHAAVLAAQDKACAAVLSGVERGLSPADVRAKAQEQLDAVKRLEADAAAVTSRVES